jgi:hypothetical protein
MTRSEELQVIHDLPESVLRVPIRVPTIVKDGRKSHALGVRQLRGTRPPSQMSYFTSTAPW